MSKLVGRGFTRKWPCPLNLLRCDDWNSASVEKKCYILLLLLLLCKLYQTISKISTMCTLPLLYGNAYNMPLWAPLMSPREKNPPRNPPPENKTTQQFSPVPWVIWELFRRMVYMYVRSPFYEVSNFFYARALRNKKKN